jgi:cysteine desulfurase
MEQIYLDNAATTPVLPEVLEAMLPYLSDSYGNPSSIHKMGRDARDGVESSREIVAGLLGCNETEVLFTSGGTESNNLAIKGVALANRSRGKHIITSQVEHHAVLSVCEWLEEAGFDVTYLPVDSTGSVSPGDVEDGLRDDTILVSIMHGNNEVGTIEPIGEIGGLTSERGIVFHTDAVQTFGHIPTDVGKLGVDLLSLSGHKIYGPKGIGALYARNSIRVEPQIHGGGQEMKMRSSTENVPGIVGLGRAVEIASRDMLERKEEILKLRRMITRGILERIDQTRINGHPTRRLPNNCNTTIKFVEGESVVLRLDQRGIYASTGSACSSPDAEASHVLEAMGLPPEDLHSSLRLTLGIHNTEEEVDLALDALVEIVEDLREMSPLWPPG